MTEREQLRQVCRWNRQLGSENAQLIERLSCAGDKIRELEIDNTNLRAEQDAADVLLGEAMDAALGGQPR
jgi:hypothetical protein